MRCWPIASITRRKWTTTCGSVARRKKRFAERSRRLSHRIRGFGKFYLGEQEPGRSTVLRLLSDENLHGDIIKGLFRRLPFLDLARVWEVGLANRPDSEILEWAAAESRVLVTHDRRTMPKFAFERVESGLPMPGAFIVSDAMEIGQAVDERALAALCLEPEECKDLVKYFPI